MAYFIGDPWVHGSIRIIGNIDSLENGESVGIVLAEMSCQELGVGRVGVN